MSNSICPLLTLFWFIMNLSSRLWKENTHNEACDLHLLTHTHTQISENKGEDTWDSPCCMGGHMHLCLFFMPSTCGSTLSSHRLSHFVSLLLMCVCVCVWGNQSCEKKMVLDENSDLTYSHPPPPWERFKKMREGVFCSSRPPHFLGGCHVGQLSR